MNNLRAVQYGSSGEAQSQRGEVELHEVSLIRGSQREGANGTQFDELIYTDLGHDT